MIYYYALEQGISNLGAILVCTKVESYPPPNWCWARNAGSQNGWYVQKTKSPPSSENFNLEKRMWDYCSVTFTVKPSEEHPSRLQ